jgi:hypothetical protein
VAIAVTLAATGVSSARCQVDTRWPQHSMDRPRPPVVDPGPERQPVPPPADQGDRSTHRVGLVQHPFQIGEQHDDL